MKSLLVFSLLVSFTLGQITVNNKLPTPELTILNFWDPLGLTAKWRPLNSTEETPISGYKMSIWDDRRRKVNKVKVVDGVEKLVQEYEPIPTRRPMRNNRNPFPTSDPIAIVIVIGANTTEASYDRLELEVHYQMRLQAFNDEGDGPYSEPYGFKLRD